MTAWRTPVSRRTPSTSTVPCPAPRTRAPIRLRKRPNSATSGSWAAFRMRTLPLPRAAAVLRRPDARAIQVDDRVPGLDHAGLHIPALVDHLRPQGPEALQVEVDGARADGAPARIGEPHPAHLGQERPHHLDRRPHP